MRPEFLRVPTDRVAASARWTVRGECDRLTDVLLCGPAYLSPVPCCSATRESLERGFSTDTALAIRQHRRLREVLEERGVRCHQILPAPDLPDLCFTRDCAVTTPWGPVLLNPAMPHRRREVRHVERHLLSLGMRPHRVTGGAIEGGDVCVAREGLAIIGISGERTGPDGAEALATVFRAHGWDVILCHFDAYHLHLDTIFCMLDARHALACIEALPQQFLDAVRARGIRLLDACHAEARALACNIVSLDGHAVLVAAGQPRLSALLLKSGFDPVELDISQFGACGGGLHCLTMPLARISDPSLRPG
ncbi:dimethylarginine dimethylaminohydrolase family protein [Sphingomonas sp. Sphisp140]|uniref:dimethylarginine dimethylaminohydrolase family protein n=1 Tax=unclassified Sphingomonas TaxID=196159 RepID=UPI0039B08366